MAFIFITKEKTNWKYILIIVILALIVAGESLLLLRQGTNIPENKLPEEVTQDETADWKTYRNEEYGFEVKYPKNEKISYEGKTEFILQPLKVDFNSFKIIVWENSQKLTIKDYFWEGSACVQNKSICEYFHQGYSLGTIKIGEAEGFTTNIGVRSQVLVTTIDKRYIIEFLNQWPTNEEKTNIFNQMLSTFRFLE